MGVDYELWQQCRDWLISVGALEGNVNIIFLRELGAALKDGVRLCKLANILKDGCIENRSIYYVISDSSFSREKNIVRFLKACQDDFHLDESDLFAPSDLEQFEQFKNVLKTISALSHTTEAVSKGFTPFPETPSPLQQFPPSSDDIYCNLQNEVEAIDDKIYDAIFYSNDDEDAKLYDRIVVQSKGVEDTWATFKPVSKREHQIKELLDTETRYVKNCLEMLMRDFYAHLKPMMGVSDFTTVFGNIAEIHKTHQSFHSNLRRAVLITLGLAQRTKADVDITIGNVFLNTKTSFLAYADYCAHMKAARERLDEIERSEELTRKKIRELTELQRANGADGSSFSLQDYLSVPFQRICKYHLILKNIVESTEVKDPERPILQKALDACDDVVNYVNEAKRDYELMDVINSIERSIDGIDKLYPANLCTERPNFQMYGRLQLDGPVKLTDSKENSKQRQRYVFIFERVILICKRLKNSRYEFKSAYKLAEYGLEDTVEANHPSLQIKPTSTLTRKFTQSFFDSIVLTLVKLSDTEPHSLQIVLKTFAQRDGWKRKIQEAIDKNNPAIGKIRHHELAYSTFDSPTNCDVCLKLLLGKFYQGYRCSRCNRNFHFDCLSTAYCRQRSSQSRNSEPGFYASNSFKIERYVALQSVNTQDPKVLAFDRGEELVVYHENDDGTLVGRRADLPGQSGLISRESVRKVLPPGLMHQRDSTGSLGASSTTTMQCDLLDQSHRSQMLCSEKIFEMISAKTVESQPWYFGIKDRLQANDLLFGKADGTFIVRLSPKENKLIISVNYQGACKHMKIENTDFGEGPMYYLHDAKIFESVLNLVEYYRSNSLAEGFDKIDSKLTQTLLKTRVFRVLHDYKHQTSENAKYLELRRGQTVTVLDTTGEDKGWWRFQVGDKTGFFPMSYVSAVLDDDSINGDFD